MQSYRVVQDSQAQRVELWDDAGNLVKIGPARINLQEYLVHAVADEAPVLATVREGAAVTEESFQVRQYSVNQVASIFEELTAKMYDQMKARTLTAIEAATGQTDIGSKPLGRQIGYALDDAKRVALEVLEKQAPEVTPEMLAKATEIRQTAETEDRSRLERERISTQVVGLEWELDKAKENVASIERQIKRLKSNQEAASIKAQIGELYDRLNQVR